MLSLFHFAINPVKIRLVAKPIIGHGRFAYLRVVFRLHEIDQTFRLNDPHMTGIAKCPTRSDIGRNPTKHAAGLQDAPDIGPLIEKETPIALLADVLHDIESRHGIERIIFKRQWQLSEIPYNIRAVVGV